jgi:hypothetical protein
LELPAEKLTIQLSISVEYNADRTVKIFVMDLTLERAGQALSLLEKSKPGRVLPLQGYA